MKIDTARHFWVRSPGQGEIVSSTLDPAAADTVLVRTLYSGISRGTESLVFRGEVPQSQYESMRAPFQEGSFPGPVKYGYASVGEVLDGPDDLEGRTVFCLHPHQDLYRVPSDAVTPLPERVPPGRAVLAANMETALNGIWDARPGPGDRIVVVGGGVVGALVAWLCGRLPGAEVTLLDIDPRRADIASTLGVRFVEPPAGRPDPEIADADLVVHASGNPDGLTTALGLAGVEATVLEMSWFGDAEVTVPLGEAFHERRLDLRSSQVGRIPADRAARWSHRRRMALAVSLLEEPALDVLVSGESDFDDLPQVMATLASRPDGALCHRIRYPRD